VEAVVFKVVCTWSQTYDLEELHFARWEMRNVGLLKRDAVEDISR
jgi:hypothetical protein